PTTHTSTLSLHDALPIYDGPVSGVELVHLGDLPGELRSSDLVLTREFVADIVERLVLHLPRVEQRRAAVAGDARHKVRAIFRRRDRKSTRLNSSHDQISY